MTTAKFLPLLLGGLLLSGCVGPTITNLTPSQLPRNANGLYPFEALWNSRERTVHPETIQPLVVIGTNTYSMQRAPVLTNRWETLVPIPDSERFIYYQYKFDYEYDSIPQRRHNSKLSAPFKLEIIDKPAPAK